MRALSVIFEDVIEDMFVSCDLCLLEGVTGATLLD